MLLTRAPLYSSPCGDFLVRLACVRHAASVDSEPGSNSRLKPDVCRRVVGRLPSPHIQDNWQKSPWFQQRGMAPPFSLRFLPKKEKKFMVVYLVRSYRTYARIRSLTTGTFNLVVKDRIAFRLSGAPSVQANPHECESDCPRNPLNISSAPNPVNACIPQHFHVFFHIRKLLRSGTTEELNQPKSLVIPSGITARNLLLRELKSTQRYCLPLWILQRRRVFGARRSGRQKIEKRS